MKILYFAWLRERTGHAEEVLEPPADVDTVADLIAWLKTRGEEYQHAFANDTIVRAAIDRTHVPLTAPIADAREIAFFPPMTGG